MVDGIKAMSRGFSFGKKVRKFANTENESFSKLHGGLLIIIRRAYIFQTNKLYIGIIAKVILVYLQNNVNLILTDGFLHKVFERYMYPILARS